MPIRIAREAAARFGLDDGPGAAAEIAYRTFLAIVPFFIFLAALSAFVASLMRLPDPAQQAARALEGNVPANVASVLTEQIARILREPRPALLSISLAFTLFAATGATQALIKAMNRAYGVPESRPFAKKYLVAIGLTLLAATALVFGFALLMTLRFFAGAIAASVGLGKEYELLVGLLPLPLVALALVAGSGVLYWIGPDRRHTFRSVLPGAALFAIAWLAATFAFSLYVDTLGSYDATYGALGSIVVLLVWLYVSAAILLAGAEVNAAIAKLARPSRIDEVRPGGGAPVRAA